VVGRNLFGGSPLHPWFVIFRLGCLAPVGLVLVLVLLVVFVIAPLVIALVELLAVLLVGTVAVAARVLFRRPWVVEAVSGDAVPQVLTWRVVGWRASAAKVDEVADQLEAGLGPTTE
jgi:xanthosine utilization system XapX-like protein